ncbi:MAG TPA: RNA polymerase sigma-70 factor [Lacibacter sp.]|nr:RNA polymerase sigma-70 factor [Lacibacter sp.]
MHKELGQIKELQRRITLYEDELAYKQLFFLLFSSLTRFSAAIIKSKEQAEEIVSDVFIQLWINRKHLQEIEDLQLYLFIAVKNNSVQKLRQTEKKKTISLDDLAVEMDSLDQNPEDRVLSSESMQAIERAIQHLPPRARLIFKLAKEDRMRYKDIAVLLNISVKTIDHQLSIALKKLTETLGASIRKKR